MALSAGGDRCPEAWGGEAAGASQAPAADLLRTQIRTASHGQLQAHWLTASKPHPSHSHTETAWRTVVGVHTESTCIG